MPQDGSSKCTVAPDVAYTRISRRLQGNVLRAAHDDRSLLQHRAAEADAATPFVPLALPAPTLSVDTTNGYHPAIADTLTFINTRP